MEEQGTNLVTTQPEEHGDNVEVMQGGGGTNSGESSAVTNAFGVLDNLTQKLSPARYQQLVTNEDVRNWSLYALRYGIFADAVTGSILQPNYAIMARPGADDESFDSTDPFDASSVRTARLLLFALLWRFLVVVHARALSSFSSTPGHLLYSHDRFAGSFDCLHVQWENVG